MVARGCYEALEPKAELETSGAYRQKDYYARALILNSLDDHHGNQVVSLGSAMKMWERLHQIYTQRSKSNKILLQKEFFDLQMKPNERAQDFIARAEVLGQELGDVGIELTESTLVAKIVSGLTDQYATFMSIWIGVREHEQTMPNLIARLMAEDQIKNKKKAGENSALNAQAGPSGSKKASNNNQKPNNKRGRRKKKGQKGDDKKKNECFNCGKEGHWKSECPDKKSEHKNDSKKKNSSDKSEAIFAAEHFMSSGLIGEEWILDSGASEHMTYDRSAFCRYEELENPKTVRFGDNHQGTGLGVGEIDVISELDNGISKKLTLKNVLYVPEVRRQLFSVSAATDNGSVGQIDKERIVLKNSEGEEQIVAERDGRLYRASLKIVGSEAEAAATSDDLTLWHERFGHINKTAIIKMYKENSVSGLTDLTR